VHTNRLHTQRLREIYTVCVINIPPWTIDSDLYVRTVFIIVVRER